MVREEIESGTVIDRARHDRVASSRKIAVQLADPSKRS